MATDPAGEYSLPLHYLRETLAASSSFQTWIGTTGTSAEKLAAARLRIHYYGTESATRPFAVVSFAESFSRYMISGGARHFFATSSNPIRLTFDADIAVADVDALSEALFKFTNQIGAIFTNMEALAGTAGYLAFTEYTIDNPTRCKIDQREANDSAMDIWQIDTTVTVEED